MRFAVLALALCLLFANDARAGVFNPQTFTLENGMKVVVVPNHRAPIVVHMVWYGVGSADEPPGKSGIAHFLEHLMFKGTKTVASGEFSRIVRRNGGRDNAFTSNDYTGYYQMVASDRLELMMEMEADRMTGLLLRDEDIQPERMVVMEERRARVDNKPSVILSEHVDAALYMNHPYRRPVIGWMHEIESLDKASILDFYRRWYAPNNAALVVVGDITAETLRPMAERTYGRIPPVDGMGLDKRARPGEPPQRAARRVTLSDERVGQPVFSRSYLAPSYLSGETERAVPTEVLVEILGGGATSRLYRSLVMEKKLAINAGAYYGAESMGPAAVVVYATPAEGVAMPDLEAAVDAEIAKLLADGVTAKEVERITKRLRWEAVFDRDKLVTAAHMIGRAVVMGRSLDDVESWPDRVAAVSKADADAAARGVFQPERSVTAWLLRKEKAAP